MRRATRRTATEPDGESVLQDIYMNSLLVLRPSTECFLFLSLKLLPE